MIFIQLYFLNLFIKINFLLDKIIIEKDTHLKPVE